MVRVSHVFLLFLAVLGFSVNADELPECVFVDSWFTHYRCQGPLEDLHCESDIPVCQCGGKQRCSVKAAHNTRTSGEVPCTYMCKSVAKTKVEEKNNDRYNMGLMLP